jgi:outer membrane receptor for ferrienterochelin and colicin
MKVKMMQKTRTPQTVAVALLMVSSLVAVAQQAPVSSLPTVEVIGATVRPSLTQITEDVQASPASVTVLGRKELEQKAITTYGDIFRGVTGVSVAEYGQGLVAYEIKFRGFTSGHGRDVAVYRDGMPLNVTGSQHTNGYMDLAQLIPELLDRVEIVRGPFSSYAGNPAVAGSMQLYTGKNVATSIKATVDNFGRLRVLPIFRPVSAAAIFYLRSMRPRVRVIPSKATSNGSTYFRDTRSR